MAQKTDTIAAIATASGQGGIGVVRLSGPNLETFCHALLGFLPQTRLACYTPFIDCDGSPIDRGIALYFTAPHSYTGETVLELQGHGGVAVMQLLLQRCLALGARLAHPGEFTQRAFLNGKLDLAQAESVADLIAATTQQAARSAARSLQGDFSAAIRDVVAMLIDLRVYAEALIDFPEEEDVPLQRQSHLDTRLSQIRAQLVHIRDLARQGSILREGAQIVLVGAPNAGKSSLLNCLAGEEVALVSDIPGTTRDAIRLVLQINGVPLHLVDTAGVRETKDAIELLGIARTRENIAKADMVLILLDEAHPIHLEDDFVRASASRGTPLIFIHNKIDLLNKAAKVEQSSDAIHLYLSAKTGAGIDALKQEILKLAGWQHADGVFMARSRHLAAIATALKELDDAAAQHAALELVAESLRQAQHALNTITGEFVADDLLGEIFGRFCIGK